MVRSRAELRIPPPGTVRHPMRAAASKASQNPRNGPKENAKKMPSFAVTPAALNTCAQLPIIQSHVSGVSSHLTGLLVVPLVWLNRV